VRFAKDGKFSLLLTHLFEEKRNDETSIPPNLGDFAFDFDFFADDGRSAVASVILRKAPQAHCRTKRARG
jgi:hypothetical protein